MRQSKNVSFVLLWIVLLAVGGAGALAVRISADSARISNYQSAVSQARAKAEKGIYYYAKQDYLRAFSIYAGEQDLFREFLDFLKNAEDGSYREYLSIYLGKYPSDTEAHEKLIEIYYSEKNYKRVQELLNDAVQAGAKSEKLAEYWEDVRYKFAEVAGGYTEMTNFFGNQAIVERNDKKGLYMHGSGLILPARYDEISFLVNGAVAVKEGGDCYFADGGGHKSGVLSAPVDSLSILSNGFCAVSSGGKYGYTTSALTVPEKLPYEYASAFSEGVAGVKTGGKWGIVDSSGNYVAEPVFDEIFLTEFNTITSAGVIFAKRDGGYRMLNVSGSELTPETFDRVCGFHYSGQPAAVMTGGKWRFIQKDGQYLNIDIPFKEVKSFSGGLAPVSPDGVLWGYMDLTGKIVIEPQFADCGQFSEYGLAPVKKGEIWSMIQLLSCT